MGYQKKYGYMWGLFRDVGVCLVLFLQWVIAGLAVDATSNAPLSTRKAVSLYLATITLAVNAVSLLSSFSATGRKMESRRNTETLTGVFFEVLTSCQGWGMAFCAARLWSLDADHVFLKNTFLFQLADSVFEMTLVQGGVGFVNATPITTVAEKIVAWLTCTIGGVLTVNFFLASVILGRRAWWLLAIPSEDTAPFVAPVAAHETSTRSVVPLLPIEPNDRRIHHRVHGLL